MAFVDEPNNSLLGLIFSLESSDGPSDQGGRRLGRRRSQGIGVLCQSMKSMETCSRILGFLVGILNRANGAVATIFGALGIFGS